MGTAAVLDIERLVASITADSPVGLDLSADFAPNSLYQQVKDARLQALAEERNLEKGDEANPDWKPVLTMAQQALAEKSKDLRLVVYLTEAAVRAHGFAGLRDGLQ